MTDQMIYIMVRKNHDEIAGKFLTPWMSDLSLYDRSDDLYYE
jgi:hypothetical protein